MEILLLVLIVPALFMLGWLLLAGLAGLPLLLQLAFIVIGGKLLRPRRSPEASARPPR